MDYEKGTFSSTYRKFADAMHVNLMYHQAVASVPSEVLEREEAFVKYFRREGVFPK